MDKGKRLNPPKSGLIRIDPFFRVTIRPLLDTIIDVAPYIWDDFREDIMPRNFRDRLPEGLYYPIWSFNRV